MNPLRRLPRNARSRGRGLAALVLFALTSLLLGVCPEVSPALAESNPGYLVVVHPDNPASRAARSFLANLFLKEATRWHDGEAARPVDRTRDALPRRRFSEDVLNRSVAAVKSYWQQRIFSGRGVPPPELDSDQAVITYVTTHRGGVGYVSPTTELGRAKPLRIE